MNHHAAAPPPWKEPAAPRPSPGEDAPDFALRNHHGETVELGTAADGPVVLMFYPFAFSTVCGEELTEVHRRWGEFQQAGVRLLAISCDAVHTLRAYAEHLQVAVGAEKREGLELLSDFWPHGAVAQRYAAFNAHTGAAQRVSFLLDEHLQVRHHIASENNQPRSLDRTLGLLRQL